MAKLSNAAQSRVIVVGVASARNGVALEAGQRYLVTASTDCTVKQGSSAVTVATGDAGAFFMAKGAGVYIDVDGSANAYLAVIQLAAAGHLYITCEEGGGD